MKIDILHNKLIADTVTDEFRASLEAGLITLIKGEYDGVEEIQMYEDYIPDNLERDGYWYYPMTAVKDGAPFTVWVKWNVSDKSLFVQGIPYAYIGTEPLEFSLARPTAELSSVIEGRSIYFEGGCIKLTIDTSAPAPTFFLAGKYSQTFVDEMTRQLTKEIAKAMSVEGLADSNVELRLIFAPDTYMEHTCENVTYRRLLITDKGCGARDFWIKWTRNNSAVAYSISDHVSHEDITFELGEDVAQKTREREYRFLVRANTDKYHYSMGRKNITEWRDLIKRAIRRGDLTKVISEIELTEHSSEVHDKLSDLLARFGVPTATEPEAVEEAPDEELDLALKLTDELLESNEEADEELFDIVNADDEPAEEDAPFELADADESAPAAQDIFAVIDDYDDTEDFAAIADDEPEAEQPAEDKPEPIKTVVKTIEVPVAVDESRIRAEIEAKLRLEYETAARRRAEEQALSLKANMDREREEAERLRREHELLLKENEKLVKERETLELQKAAEIQRRREEEQRLREEIEARKKAEERERERLEEAAILAIENQRRAELEKLEEERRIKEEAERAERERLRLEEEARLEAERQAEIERIRASAVREEPAPVTEAPKATSVFEIDPLNYTYTSKTVTLMFKTLVDPNLIKKIQEIMIETVKKLGKEKVSIRVKAKTVDERTVILDFLKIPEEEIQLLIDIVNTLGRSNIGIIKATIK